MKWSLVSIVFVMAFCAVQTAYATITETQALSFGSFALRNNNGVYDLVISPTGGVTADPEFVVISNGQEAQFNVSAFPALTTLIITVSAANLTDGGGGEEFSLTNFQTSPATVVTTGAGTASFGLGTTLQTSGTTTVYTDGAYSGSATVSVNF